MAHIQYAAAVYILVHISLADAFLPLIVGGAIWDGIKTQGVPLETLKIRDGDVIRCNLRRGIGFDHWMLALNRTHMIGTSFNNIRIQPFDVKRGFNKQSCFNDGPGKLGREVSIDRALKFADVPIHYNLLRCNCEHFVKHWTEGSSGKWYDNQSLLPSSHDCEV